MKRIEIFEGYYDIAPGWEFDAPVFMIKPICRYDEVGSTGYVDDMIENYQIDISVYGKAKPYDCPHKLNLLFDYWIAKLHLSKRLKYWKRVIEWNTETCHQKILKSIG